MAKDQKPADQMDAFSKQAMAQAHEALDTYFDFLKKTVSAFRAGFKNLHRPRRWGRPGRSTALPADQEQKLPVIEAAQTPRSHPTKADVAR